MSMNPELFAVSSCKRHVMSSSIPSLALAVNKNQVA